MAFRSISEAMSGEDGADRKSPQHANAMDSHGGHTQLHDHGDGTYHSVTPDGEKTEHPHIGHAMAHIAHHHVPDGAHSHVHHADGMHTSHHAKDGAVEGPHDHENLEALKQHMGKFLNEEENEGSDYGEKPDGGNNELFS